MWRSSPAYLHWVETRTEPPCTSRAMARPDARRNAAAHGIPQKDTSSSLRASKNSPGASSAAVAPVSLGLLERVCAALEYEDHVSRGRRPLGRGSFSRVSTQRSRPRNLSSPAPALAFFLGRSGAGGGRASAILPSVASTPRSTRPGPSLSRTRLDGARGRGHDCSSFDLDPQDRPSLGPTRRRAAWGAQTRLLRRSRSRMS